MGSVLWGAAILGLLALTGQLDNMTAPTLYAVIFGIEAVLMLLFLPVSLRAKRAENGGELPPVPALLFVNVVQVAIVSAGLFIVVQVIAYFLTGDFIG
jgi:FtsH-binding integral membrane protein